MRRGSKILFLCALMLVLTSCVSSSKNAEESAKDIRTLLIDSGIVLTAEVKADYGERVYDFTLTYDTVTGLIEVKAPEVFEGLTVTVSEEEDSTVLTYDGVELDTGPLSEDGLSPVSAIPVLIRQWREGYILESYFETWDSVNALAMRTNISDDVVSTSWFDRSTGLPVKSEIASDDQVVIQCIFSGVAIA